MANFKPKTGFMSLDSFVLEPVSPFRLDLTVWTLRRRLDNVVDRWDGHTYRRVLPLPAGVAEVSVTQSGPPEMPRLRVTMGAATLSPGVRQSVATILERLLGFRTDVATFYSLASRDTALGPLAQRFRGMKPPRFATIFESVITAMARQQVTKALSVLLLNRLAIAYGQAVHKGDVVAYAFPQAEALATLHPAHLRELGFSGQKGCAMIDLARSITEEELDLERLDAAGFLAVETSHPQTAPATTPILRMDREIIPMKLEFNVGDHVEWNSEAGRPRSAQTHAHPRRG